MGGALPAGLEVRSVTTQPLGGGRGFASALVRLRLEYAAAPEGVPASIVAKLPSQHAPTVQVSRAGGIYEREVRFYQRLANVDAHPAHPLLGAPACYYADVEDGGQRFILLLEDLAQSRTPDQLAGVTVEDARLTVRELAAFHAHWRDAPALDAHAGWLPRPGTLTRVHQLGLLTALRRLVRRPEGAPPIAVPGTVLQAGKLLAEAFPRLEARTASRALTLVHGDMRLDNLLFPSEPAGRFAAVDWQLVHAGNGLEDVARFLLGSLPAEARRDLEPPLLRLYHETLLAHGVRDYDFAACLEDYRYGVFPGLFTNLVAASSLDLTTAREREAGAGTTMAAALLDPLAEAIEAHDLLSLLE